MAEERTLGTPLSVNIEVSKEREKPRLLALLFCDFASFTKDDKVNLLGIFDRIFVDSDEKRTPRFAVFTRVAEVTGFTTTIFDPDGMPSVQAETKIQADVKFTEGYPRQMQTLTAMQFEIRKPGVYWFDISFEGESLGGAGLAIEYRQTEEKQSGTDTYV